LVKSTGRRISDWEFRISDLRRVVQTDVQTYFQVRKGPCPRRLSLLLLSSR